MSFSIRRFSIFKLLVLVAWVVPATGGANPRLEARRHFKTGMALIEQGKWEEGIAELEEAYAIRPHPDVLFNMAKANEEAGHTQTAVDLFRRYLESDPPDAPKVLQTLARLEERLKDESDTPASTSAARPPPVAPSPGKSAAEAARVEALKQQLDEAVARAELAERQLALKDSGPPTPEDQPAPYEERVVTASFWAQSTWEAPYTVTVITGEEIRLTGLTSVAALLRRIPGMDVMEMGVGSANVSLRGFNQRLSNKVLVLVDGRAEFEDIVGSVLWRSLPLGVEEIERIEVIRGPSSTLYGGNAFLGVVNIITRSPGSKPVFQAIARGGTGAFGNGAASVSSKDATGKFRYRASAGYDQEYKWTRDFADGRADVVPEYADTSLGFRGGRGQLQATYSPIKNLSFGLSGGIQRFWTELYALGLLRNVYFDGTAGHTTGHAALGPALLRFHWNHLSGFAGPQYTLAGLPRQSTALEQNRFDLEFLYGSHFELAGQHRFSIGGSGRFQRVSWAWLGPHLRSQNHAAAFVQDEWAFAKPFRLAGSYRLDVHPLLNNGAPGTAHSPRLSLMWMPWEGNGFRASVASAFREPTFLESYADLRVPVPGLSGASVQSIGNTTLQAERVLAFELGYQGEFPRAGLTLEVSLYQNHVSNLIALGPAQPIAAADSYDPSSGTYLLGSSTFVNESTQYIARGVEVGTRFSPVDGLSLQASLALQMIKSDGPSSCGACTQTPGPKVFAGVTYRTPIGFDLSLEGSFTGQTRWLERAFNTTNATQVEWVTLALPAYGFVNARVGYRLFSDKVTVAIVGTHLGRAAAQHPFGNRVESRVFGTLEIAP